MGLHNSKENFDWLFKNKLLDKSHQPSWRLGYITAVIVFPKKLLTFLKNEDKYIWIAIITSSIQLQRGLMNVSHQIDFMHCIGTGLQLTMRIYLTNWKKYLDPEFKLIRPWKDVNTIHRIFYVRLGACNFFLMLEKPESLGHFKRVAVMTLWG